MATGQAGSTRDTARAGMDGRMNLVSFCFLFAHNQPGKHQQLCCKQNSQEISPHLLQQRLQLGSGAVHDQESGRECQNPKGLVRKRLCCVCERV